LEVRNQSLEKRNVLVTGGAGFIGSHLVDALVAEGHRVRLLDALVPQVHGDAVPPHLNPSAEFLRADVCSRDAVDNALEGIDAVFHEAAEVGVGQSMYEIERYVRANDLERRYCSEAILARAIPDQETGSRVDQCRSTVKVLVTVASAELSIPNCGQVSN
jgi:dTDP-L-rhamnose 4-epimerase